MLCTQDERVLLEQMAEWRADSCAWDTIAQKLGRSVQDLNSLRYHHSRLWKQLLAEARREWLANANQEAMMAVLNVINQPKDDNALLKAANIFARLVNTQEKLTTPSKPTKPKIAANVKTDPATQPPQHHDTPTPSPEKPRPPRPTIAEPRDPRPTTTHSPPRTS